MEVNLFGAYFEGAFLAAIASCFINGRISEQQIDATKEKEELKRQLKQFLDAKIQGLKDKLRAQGKLW